MPLFVMIGALLMSAALILYTIGIAMTVITGKIRRRQIVLQILAVCSDVMGTICMIINSNGQFIPADIHGWIGYIALIGMIFDLLLVIKHTSEDRIIIPVRIYSALVWLLWVISYSMGFVKMG